MRIIIAGSRDFDNYDILKKECDESLKVYKLVRDIEIVSGHAKGADTLGERYAKENQYNLQLFPADWDQYGKSAGFIRNRQMAIYAKEDEGKLVAFWDEKSKGTYGMMKICWEMNIPVSCVFYKRIK